MRLIDIPIEIYADGADLPSMLAQAEKPYVKGLTTNPTLMRKAGVNNYQDFAKELLAHIKKPISFEVFADDHADMIAQARLLASMGPNVFVKIPVVNSEGVFSGPVIRELLDLGISVNVTALMSYRQRDLLGGITAGRGKLIYSVFAGRIADCGENPKWVIGSFRELASLTGARVLWASTRQAYSIIEAQRAVADIITVPSDLLEKADKFYGMDLDDLSLETVRQFKRDSAGYFL